MAKRTNIINVLVNEIRKGNVFLQENGNFVSEDMTSNNIQEMYIKALRNGEVSMDTTPEQFKQKALEGNKKAEDLLKVIKEFLGIKEMTETDMNPPVETSEQKGNVSCETYETKEKLPYKKPEILEEAIPQQNGKNFPHKKGVK